MAIVICVGVNLAEAGKQDPCIDVLTPELNRVLKRDYPNWVVVYEPDWRNDELMKEQARKNVCPWGVKVDFYGNGRLVYAIVIEKKSQDSTPYKIGKLLLAQAEKERRWTLVTLLDNTCPCPIIIKPPGKYKDVNEDKEIKSKGEVVLHYSQSVAIVFAWTGEKIDKVHIAD